MKAATTACTPIAPTMQNIVEFGGIIAAIVVLVYLVMIACDAAHRAIERMKR